MTTLQQIRSWSAAHHPKWLVIIRIGLGLILMAKGINFMHDTSILNRLFYGSAEQAQNNIHWLPIIITWADLLSGVMILIGMWTRLMCLLQVPILVGAVIFMSQQGGYAADKEMGMAILALVLTIFFLVEGSGPLSLDSYFERNAGRGSHGDNLPG
jgi:uncharacterized membrane protein YphA (DoxX/SURF4 family)